MKRIISIIVLNLLTLAVINTYAEENYIDKLHEELKGKEGVTFIKITKSMIKSFNKGLEDSQKAKELAQLSEGLENMVIINIERAESGISAAKIKEIQDHLQAKYKGYKVMMEMNYDGQNLKMLMNKEKKDYMFYKFEKDNILIINAKGDINISELMNAAIIMEMAPQKRKEE